jgi:transcriptional regulator with XRE-family HTH domain
MSERYRTTDAERRFNRTLGRNIRRELLRSCLLQKQLAHALQMDPGHVSKRLAGETIITVRDFTRMIRYVGTSVDAVITPEVRALAEEARLAP